MSTSPRPPKNQMKLNEGSGIGLGIAIGTAIGVATDNIGLWLPLGIVFGVAVGSAARGNHKDRED